MVIHKRGRVFVMRRKGGLSLRLSRSLSRGGGELSLRVGGGGWLLVGHMARRLLTVGTDDAMLSRPEARQYGLVVQYGEALFLWGYCQQRPDLKRVFSLSNVVFGRPTVTDRIVADEELVLEVGPGNVYPCRVRLAEVTVSRPRAVAQTCRQAVVYVPGRIPGNGWRVNAGTVTEAAERVAARLAMGEAYES